MGREVNIIAATLDAKVSTVISYSDRDSAGFTLGKAGASDDQSQVAELAIGLAAKFGLGQLVNVIAESEEIRTVAFQPAMIANRQVFRAIASDEVVPFDPQDPRHLASLALLAAEWTKVRDADDGATNGDSVP